MVPEKRQHPWIDEQALAPLEASSLQCLATQEPHFGVAPSQEKMIGIDSVVALSPWSELCVRPANLGDDLTNHLASA
jgi:hypothetical protein